VVGPFELEPEISDAHQRVSGKRKVRNKRHARSVDGPQASAQASPVYRGWFSRHRMLLAALGLVMLSVALYAPTIHHPFTSYDDREYVTENSHVRSGLGWNTIRWSFTSSWMGFWHPLTWMSLAP
jgi:hypothetical protein